ncbi:hypothetical protein [Gordonia sp. OPL2]|uniref:hypothetical protein n=1 Tax=Gordonia sp. OPL2 TaxID=2486274 RepID=UPI001655322A|nr:hypothetical protein [Gordonia sp. OPL2]ROZ89346.1 hypothetical protein EEB19_17955 [Gordonia sp. OPL2]
MRDPHSAIPDEATPAWWRRYDNWRAERHLQFDEKHARRLRSWRNRRGARRLVRVQIVSLAVALIGAGMAFGTPWFVVPFIVGLAGSIATQYALRVVTGSVADTPVPALDEIQLAQRNSARSIGFFALYTLMFIPYVILMILGSRDSVDGDLVYGTGVLQITLVVVAVVLPTMLTAWWMNDPDPEDLIAAETPFPETDRPQTEPTDSERSHR